MKLLFENWRQYLKEEQASPQFLYHGTNIKNLESIQKDGLMPEFGELVKSTSGYGYYMDDEYFDPSDRKEGILFFDDTPETWGYGSIGNKNMDEVVLVQIENNDSIYRKVDNKYYNFDGEEADEIDYTDVDRMPPFIENGDYFSFDPQEPVKILSGEELTKFIENN